MRERIGKFDLLKPLGEGAMGEVYLARDPMLGREVAIKVIRQDSTFFAAKRDLARERFFREARAAGNLNHPNLVTVHEFGEDGDVLFIAMEFVPGEDLVTLLDERRLAPAETLEILAQVCDGLAHAHGRGVLHRDIKPSNIRVARQDGRPLAKLMDFGIARQGGSDLTGTGTLVGTFGYMAPEYVQGGKASTATDLFAVGVILYEALAGRRAFQGDTGATVLYKIVHQQPDRLEPAAIAGLSPAIQALVDRALAKDPGWRFPDAAALATALRAATDPAWKGPQDWQEDATREAARPLLPAGPVRPAPVATPAQPPAPAGRIPIILTRPAEPEDHRPWLWPALTGATLVLVGGVWAVNRTPAARPAAAQVPAPPVTAAPAAQAPLGQAPVQPAPSASPASAEPQPPQEGAAPGAVPLDPPRRPEPPPPRDEGRRDPEGFEGALRDVDARPEQALAFFERALRDDPDHLPSHVLRLCALHRLNRVRDFRNALEEARNAGITPLRMEPIPHFRRMLEDERRAPRLPRDVYAALTEGLPAAPGGPPGLRPGG